MRGKGFVMGRIEGISSFGADSWYDSFESCGRNECDGDGEDDGRSSGPLGGPAENEGHVESS